MFLHVLHGQSFQRKESCGPIARQQSHKPARARPCANTSLRASRKARRRRAAPPIATCRAIPNKTGTPRRLRRRRGWGSQTRTPAGQDHQRRNPLRAGPPTRQESPRASLSDDQTTDFKHANRFPGGLERDVKAPCQHTNARKNRRLLVLPDADVRRQRLSNQHRLRPSLTTHLQTSLFRHARLSDGVAGYITSMRRWDFLAMSCVRFYRSNGPRNRRVRHQPFPRNLLHLLPHIWHTNEQTYHRIALLTIERQFRFSPYV